MGNLGVQISLWLIVLVLTYTLGPSLFVSLCWLFHLTELNKDDISYSHTGVIKFFFILSALMAQLDAGLTGAGSTFAG